MHLYAHVDHCLYFILYFYFFFSHVARPISRSHSFLHTSSSSSLWYRIRVSLHRFGRVRTGQSNGTGMRRRKKISAAAPRQCNIDSDKRCTGRRQHSWWSYGRRIKPTLPIFFPLYLLRIQCTPRGQRGTAWTREKKLLPARTKIRLVYVVCVFEWNEWDNAFFWTGSEFFFLHFICVKCEATRRIDVCVVRFFFLIVYFFAIRCSPAALATMWIRFTGVCSSGP